MKQKRENWRVFPRRALSAEEFRLAADARLTDAQRLRDAKRTLGSFYLAGYVVECLLKAVLLERRTARQRQRTKTSLRDDESIQELCSSHRVDEMIAAVIMARGKQGTIPNEIVTTMRKIAGSWSVNARYETKFGSLLDAQNFVAAVESVHICLQRR